MEKEVSCINSGFILDYMKEQNTGECSGLLENLHPEIDALSDPETFLRDPHNWISCGVICEMLKRAKSILQDEKAPYKIARFAVENTSLGYGQRIIVKAFWSSKLALKHAQKINDKWNRTKRIELVEIGRNEGVVRLHWDSQMAVTKDLCMMNQGVYTFLPLIWGGKPLRLTEECCYFEEEKAPYCEYHMNWTFRNSFHEFFSKLFTSKSVLAETVREMEEDKQVIEKKYEEVNRLNVELNQRIKQLMAIQETGKAILSVLDLEQLLDVIMSILSSVCRIHRALIMLVNEEDGCLEYIHGLGFAGAVPEEIRDYRVSLDRLSNILVRVTNTGRPEYIPDVKSSKLRRENIILTYGQPTSAYVVPLITRSKVIGVIATDAVDSEGVSEETRETLQVFAPQIAIAIENARLYTRLQEQMLELKRSHALLSRAEKFSFLGNLAARLAHEIKNPMTAIGTFIQLLPTKYEDEEFRRDFHKIALEETERVNSLITELLDLVKPKESQFMFDDLNSLIDKMILLVSPQTNAKKIEVIRNLDPEIGQVWIDPEKMKQVFLNLLSNAVEFTPEKGRIEILTKNGPEKAGRRSISIEIRDSGAGVPQSNIDKIFDPYFTTKHKSDMHDGTGLGLFISHQNMQDHGGTIEVKSKVNEGTTFVLTIPAQTPKALSKGGK